MKLLIIIFIFIAGSSAMQAQQDRNGKTEPQAGQILSRIDSTFVQGFTDAFEEYADGTEGEYLQYYFTPQEADRFTTMLLAANYPDIDGNLSSDILKRSETVKERMKIIKKTCNKARITYMEKRIGLNDALDGILVQFAFGKDDEWKEEISILFTVFEDYLKVLTVKDEK